MIILLSFNSLLFDYSTIGLYRRNKNQHSFISRGHITYLLHYIDIISMFYTIKMCVSYAEEITSKNGIHWKRE